MTAPPDPDPAAASTDPSRPEPPAVAEKLGSFYLGRRHDLVNDVTSTDGVHYDAKDLTTHAVCVGMTGSGKTGLGVCLLEEAALDGIPALIVDPKGDMGNLLLQFPDLAPGDFAPWVDADEANRKGKSVDELAAATADLWRNGLAKWDEGPERIARLKAAADVAVFTPGSDAGIPVSMLRSFDAPSEAVANDREALSERIQGATAGLLALLGIDADPLQSRETILISSLLQEAWTKGESLDIAGLIRAIQSPPFDKLGVFDLETFYPSKERLQLAMQINALLASPGFAMWVEGQPLDIEKLLYTPEKKPRLAILSIAHLSDVERMSFVTVLLNEVISWMRSQPGTSSLRALLYMDEIFGFFPPTAEPPAKRPMLTLLKQARAYGLGVVLATQNPVDLDYKGLSNTGTWFLGRLQTERDKERVLDGLEGAMSGSGRGFDRRTIDRILSGLGKRVFLLHNVHEEEPVVFHTRWALSYLRGPMTRDEIRRRMAGHPLVKAARSARPAKSGTAASTQAAAAESMAESEEPSHEEEARPLLAAGTQERFLYPTKPAPEGGHRVYRPALAVEAKLHYSRSSLGLEAWQTLGVTAPLVERLDGPNWEAARYVEGGFEGDWEDSPVDGARFGAVPSEISESKRWRSWQKELESTLYRERPARILRCKALKLVSSFGESEDEFRARLADAGKAALDEELAKQKKRYEARIETQEDRVRRAQDKVEVQSEQYESKRRNSWLDVGSSILGAFFSKKKASSTNARRAASAAKSVGRASREKEDIARARAELESQEEKLRDLKDELELALDEAQREHDPERMDVEEVLVAPRKSDLDAEDAVLLWVPFGVDRDGNHAPLV